MLLRFGVGNHLSMRERQELSLAATSLKDGTEGLIDCAAAPNEQVVSAAVIYGANASGKSNYVAALRFMRSAVLFSHSRGEPGEGVQRRPFALDPGCTDARSIFDMEFVAEGVPYHYGFETSDEAFEAEWLHAFPNNRRQVLFEREGRKFSFGRELRGLNKVISDLTRPNSLFVSAAAQNDHEQLLKIAGFFRSLHVDTTISVPGEIASIGLPDDEVDDRVIKFLRKIGTGVVGYRKNEKNTGVVGYRKNEKKRTEEYIAIVQAIDTALQSIEAEFPRLNIENIGAEKAIELAHLGHDGKPVFFDLERESAGTRRLLVLLSRVFRVLDDGAVMAVDELDASLHTQACEAVLALFSSPATNPKGAQLIATTHDTNLLQSAVLRRDQVWFTEKDDEGATHLYPLTDIRTRKGDNIAKGYLQGRYGAVPSADLPLRLFTAG